MNISINGETRTIDDGLTVLELLDHLGLAGKKVAVEKNRDIVPKAAHGDTMLCESDKLEIVTLVGGG